MSQLIETICVQNGKFLNLEYHRQRMNRAWKDIFNVREPWILSDVLKGASIPFGGLVKCRITYDVKLHDIEFEIYNRRAVNSLKLVEGNSITYDHKFKDRTALNKLFEARDECDDVLITKNGLVTEISNANIIFGDGNAWFTPAQPLLKGTMRQFLLDRGKIIEKKITVSDLPTYTVFKIINSMLRDSASVVDVRKIVF